MSTAQCPYVRPTGEPDHLDFCQLREGHAGLHMAYGDGTKGRWFVQGLAQCPLCNGTFERRRLGYMPPLLPAVRQG
jgi:hypothetical protein